MYRVGTRFDQTVAGPNLRVCFTTDGNGILRDFANDNVNPGASGSGTSASLMGDTVFNMQT